MGLTMMWNMITLHQPFILSRFISKLLGLFLWKPVWKVALSPKVTARWGLELLPKSNLLCCPSLIFFAAQDIWLVAQVYILLLQKSYPINVKACRLWKWPVISVMLLCIGIRVKHSHLAKDVSYDAESCIFSFVSFYIWFYLFWVNATCIKTKLVT